MMMDMYFKLFQKNYFMKDQAFLVCDDFLSHVSLILSTPPFSDQHGHCPCAVATIIQ